MTALLAAMLLAGPASCAVNDAAARAAIVSDRKDTERWLKDDPSSYLRAVRRVDFGSRTELMVGSAEGSDVRLEGVLPRQLKVTAAREGFRVEALDPGASFGVGGGTKTVPEVREATVGPETLRVGLYRLRLSHQGFPAIIVFDPRSPRVKGYHGVPYFPVDLSYRYVLSLLPDARGETVTIKSSHSADRRATRVGWFEFDAGKTPCRLAAYRLQEPGAGADELSVFFQDATTGKETYSVGRYVDPEKQADGRYVLDFNMAYSPACAFSKFYNCPIPPKENRLAVAIRAGQKDPRYH